MARDVTRQNDRAWGYLSLFTSFGTLVCCALPSLLVLFGLGATVASTLTAAPWLVTLSRHKFWVFGLSGTLVGVNAYYIYRLAPRLRARAGVCATDGPDACGPADRFSRAVLWMSALIYVVGFFTAFILGPLLVRWG